MLSRLCRYIARANAAWIVPNEGRGLAENPPKAHFFVKDRLAPPGEAAG
ncbi:MAG TPA: hypothetical protein VK428_09915 [Acidimicrobiales bacterium]|nr:hypothetical protein [Acidimicrobiales bacterium]